MSQFYVSSFPPSVPVFSWDPFPSLVLNTRKGIFGGGGPSGGVLLGGGQPAATYVAAPVGGQAVQLVPSGGGGGGFVPSGMGEPSFGGAYADAGQAAVSKDISFDKFLWKM
ncbi:unnamed protein product [Nippostrongylus brasiliensis]|uniref:DAZ-associated protein 2 n=1 Tax=Nippostrongylus brasiliensis TaxID=27835 RepID=A0A0N4XTY3_NIPBR|nr:unnamed protein product [Nippostrongylus brasiliensis]